MSLYLPPAGYPSIFHYDPYTKPQDDFWPYLNDFRPRAIPGLLSQHWRCSWDNLRAILCCYYLDSVSEEWEQESACDRAQPLLSSIPTTLDLDSNNASPVASQRSASIFSPRSNVSFKQTHSHTVRVETRMIDNTAATTPSALSSSAANNGAKSSLPRAMGKDGNILPEPVSNRSSSEAGSNSYDSAMDKGTLNANPPLPCHIDIHHAAGHSLNSPMFMVSQSQRAVGTVLPVPKSFPLFSPEASSMSHQSSQTPPSARTTTSVVSISPEDLLDFQSSEAVRISPDYVDSLVARATAVDESAALDTQPRPRSKKHRSAELKKKFMNALALKKSLVLRQTITATDIGIALELLTQQVNTYTRDTATLSGALEKLTLIKKESSEQHLDLPFYAFEHLRQPLPDCLLDIIDQLFEEGRPFFAKYESSRDAALQFMNDPRALTENRLGKISSMQR